MQVAIVEMSWVALQNFFSPNYWPPETVIRSDLPKGAALIHVESVPSSRMCRLYFQHESFDPVPEGAQVPVIQPILTATRRVWQTWAP